MPQRLTLCLDGTWNNENDSTNVLHHYNLVAEGPVSAGWVQKKKYQAAELFHGTGQELPGNVGQKDSATVAFGLWFAARWLDWPFLQDWGGIPLWPALPRASFATIKQCH